MLFIQSKFERHDRRCQLDHMARNDDSRPGSKVLREHSEMLPRRSRSTSLDLSYHVTDPSRCNGYDFLNASQVVPGAFRRTTMHQYGAQRKGKQFKDANVASVPFHHEHWSASVVVGDRVVEGNDRLSRVLNMLAPRPKLQVLDTDENNEDNTVIEHHSASTDTCLELGRGPHRLASRQSFHVSYADVDISRSSILLPGCWPRNLSREGGESHRKLQIDAMTAAILPSLVPGLIIGSDIVVRDDE